MRKPFQGVLNIIRFNWQYFVLSIITIGTLLIISNHSSKLPGAQAKFLMLLIIIANLVSLLASYYIYDLSPLYKFTWLDSLPIGSKIININAGFDETSRLLSSKFSRSDLKVFDFFDPTKHKEVSIRRARKAYPPFPNTQQANTTHLPLQNSSIDNVFVILSAHEIRSNEERICFFLELNRVLKINGQVIVTEHLRDTINFLALSRPEKTLHIL